MEHNVHTNDDLVTTLGWPGRFELIIWRPAESVHFRLQYNLDHADNLGDEPIHTVWLGLDVVLGRHSHLAF